MSRYKGKKGTAWGYVKKICRILDKDCYTCGAKNLKTYNAQAGHYQPVALVGSNNRKAWDIRFIKLQCGSCNGAGQGQQGSFRRKLVADLGEDVVEAFDQAVRGKVPDPVKNWDELIESYKKILSELE